jgi:N-methylhydantoinase A
MATRRQDAAAARLAVDIGGTFTDVVVEAAGRLTTAKVLTTPAAPEVAVMEGIGRVLQSAGVTPDAIALVIHGTTLATNAVIERTGARTALITTAGFRDVLAIADESRFDQYDINLVKTEPLIPRHRRLTVAERISADGRVLTRSTRTR